jgi:hypothetical protein
LEKISLSTMRAILLTINLTQNWKTELRISRKRSLNVILYTGKEDAKMLRKGHSERADSAGVAANGRPGESCGDQPEIRSF